VARTVLVKERLAFGVSVVVVEDDALEETEVE